MLNNKYDVVARHHLVYSIGQRRALQALGGAVRREEPQRPRPGVDLEFLKRFDQCRFETTGRLVVEQLVDERVFVE